MTALADPEHSTAGRPLPATADAVLRRSPLFQGVATETMHDLTGTMRLETASSGERIFRQGDVGSELYIVLAGKIRLHRFEQGDRERLIAIVGPAELFGELSVFDPGPRTATASAATEVELAVASKRSVDAWMRARPEIATQLLRVLSRRLRRTRSETAELLFVDVAGRIARQVLELARRFGEIRDGELWVQHDLTQMELADLVGSSRETVNKVFSDFANRGWIRLERGSIVILDRERLVRRAR